MNQSVSHWECLVRDLSEAMANPIAYIGSDQRCRHANRAFVEWCGRRAAGDLVGREMPEVLAPPEHQRLLPLVRQALAGVPVRCRLDALDAGGAPGLGAFDLALVPHLGPDGTPVGCMWVVSNANDVLEPALDLVARGAPIGETLALLARATERHTPGATVSVVLHDDGGDGRRSPGAGAAASVLSEPIVTAAGQEVGAVRGALGWPAGEARLAGLRRDLRAAAQIAALAVAHHDFDERLAYLLQHDELTGLPNRCLFQEHLQLLLAGARHHESRLALVFIDIDEFKRINGALGHAAGDQLLRQIAARLRSHTREGDLVARFAGDEFVLLLRDAHDSANAGGVVSRLREVLSAPFHLGGHEVRLSAGFGVTTYPEDGADAATLLRNAGIAISRAKANGKNRVEAFTSELIIEASERLRIEEELRLAIDRRQLSLHLQPQIDLATHRLVGFEALARWSHAELGPIPPQKFIPIAEETGLIAPLGRWVLDEACRQARTLIARKWPDVRIAINVSAVELAQPGFVASVMDALRDAALPARHLEIEVTESILMRDIASVASQLTELRKLGVRVAMDDFGTGYSSLSYLQHLPIDALKIDRSFVQGLGAQTGNGADVVRSMIRLAQDLRVDVIAEGVETADQVEWLARAGCDVAQGYWFGRPAPLATFLADAAEPPPAPNACPPQEAVPEQPADSA